MKVSAISKKTVSKYKALIVLMPILISFFVFAVPDNVLRVLTSNQSEKKSVKNLPEGNLVLSDFYFPEYAQLQIWSITQDTAGTMLFATQRGVLFFDGSEHNFLTVSAIPYKISRHPHTGTIYAACEQGFGKLIANQEGKYSYVALSDTTNKSAFTSIFFTNDKIIFAGDEQISVLDSTEKNLANYNAGKDIFNSHLVYKNQILAKIGNTFTNPKAPSDIFPELEAAFGSEQIKTCIQQKDHQIIVTDKSKLFKIKGDSINPFVVESQVYLTESVVTGAVSLNDNQIAISTLNGGVLVIDIQTGKTLHTINYRTGLLDDEVFTVGADLSGGLWIAHAYGLSRADTQLPARDFTGYPGLEGKINHLGVFDSVLYAATGEGVYYLSEINDINEIQELVERTENKKKTQSEEKRSSPETINPVVVTPETETKTDAVEEKEDSGLLDRWKNKWKNRKKDKNKDKINYDDDDDTDTEVKPEVKPKTEPKTDIKPETNVSEVTDQNKPAKKTVRKKKSDPKTEVRREYELQSVKFAFKKVENLNSKAVKFYETSIGLTVSTNNGLFLILGNKAELISDKAVTSVFEGKEKIYASATDGIYTIEKQAKKTILKPMNLLEGKAVYSVLEQNGKLWLGGLNTVYMVSTDGAGMKTYALKTEFPEAVQVSHIDNVPYFFTGEAVFEYNPAAGKIERSRLFEGKLSFATRINFPKTGAVILTQAGIIQNTYGCEPYLNYLKYLYLSKNMSSVFFSDNKIWAVSKNNQILKIDPKILIKNTTFNLRITRMTVGETAHYNIDSTKQIQLDYDYGKLFVKLSAHDYTLQNNTEFYYALDSEPGYNLINGNTLTLPELSYGEHQIRFVAKNSFKEQSRPLILNVDVKSPFWHSALFWIFVSILGIAFGIITTTLIDRRKNILMQRRNEELEAEVQRRTQKILEQNAEIQAQNDEILEQNRLIADQNVKISKQNEEITDSIRYASRIQQAVLPSTEVLAKYLRGHFIYYNPRDIVSGDFYWYDKIEDELFIAAADCTGHGVPGGFLSMLGMSFLNEIVVSQDQSTGEVLDKLRAKVIKSLNQSLTSDGKDGMDIALVKINIKTLKMQYSGANNLIFHIRNGILEQIKPDRMPVGFHRNHDKNFSVTEIQLERNDLIYLFSDGYVDQFSETTRRKFSKARLQELLLEIRNLNLDDQRDIVEAMLVKWKGQYIQIDDILLIGLKV